MEHLVYTDAKSKVLDKLLSGKKTLIVRGAAGRKTPHSRVFEEETLYFIENNGSGDIVATGKVTSVFNSEKMTPDESIAILKEKKDQLQLSPQQEKRWYGKKVLCLIGVTDVTLIAPLKLDRQKNMDDWLIVEDIHDITVGGNASEFKNVRIDKK